MSTVRIKFEHQIQTKGFNHFHERLYHKKAFCPHQITTIIGAVKLYRNSRDIDYVCRKYHISNASLMRWNKAYDGTRESLWNKSHRPLTPHPNAHTEEELKWIRDYHRRNPNTSICELFVKLRTDKAYSRHPGSLYRVYVRLGYRKQVESTKKKTKHTGHYDTPKELGIKWQMDVKYIPKACYSGKDGKKHYQYTVIDEASRERHIYPYEEQSGYSTVDFVKRALAMHQKRYRQIMAASLQISAIQSANTTSTIFVVSTVSLTSLSAQKRHGITGKWNAVTEMIRKGSPMTIYSFK